MDTSDGIQSMLDDCESRESELTAWEADFIDSVSEQFANSGTISEKQEEALAKIWERVTG